MSDYIKHECGIAVLRLLKPLPYYYKKYKNIFYGLNKMYILMEKQRNRGQDGAGLANIKLDVKPGKRYISRYRSVAQDPIQDIFSKINEKFKKLNHFDDPLYLKENFPFTGELFLAHLRYGTYGKNNIESCHPVLRQNNWITRNLLLAGNFNLTNVDELFDKLIELGQHPKEKSDTVTILEKIGHFLDEEVDYLFQQYKLLGYNNIQITHLIAENIRIDKILKKAAEKWDGGYAIAGLLGHGDAFIFRDPNGIRPAYYFFDDEICVVASERPAIQTAFNVKIDKIKEITPGKVLVIKKSGEIKEFKVLEEREKKSCSFERIYFSRGNDKDIYNERKKLGKLLSRKVLESINYDLKNTVFSYIPNTAETAFLGMINGIEDILNKIDEKNMSSNTLFAKNSNSNSIVRPRIEKVAIKDIKLRTFISADESRNELVSHVYDITYGTINKGKDTLVVLDDSIVRGTTLKKSILKILDRLEPKEIIIVSSSPQIRYPDCYGIDMAKLGDFIAFKAAISLLKEKKIDHLIDEIYFKAKEQLNLPKPLIKNMVKKIYEPFTVDEISEKIAELLTPENMKAKVKIIFQSIEGLHKACPNNKGDWYFTGDYPTPGGNKVANKAYINYVEGKNVRAY